MSLTSRKYITVRKNALISLLPGSLERFKSDHIRGMSLLWEEEGDVTPQAILDEIGTDSAELFLRSSQLVDFIKTQDPDWEPVPVPYEFTINEDGTVTLGAKKEETET